MEVFIPKKPTIVPYHTFIKRMVISRDENSVTVKWGKKEKVINRNLTLPAVSGNYVRIGEKVLVRGTDFTNEYYLAVVSEINISKGICEVCTFWGLSVWVGIDKLYTF